MIGTSDGPDKIARLIEEHGKEAMCEMWTPMGAQIHCRLGEAWDELDRYDHHDQRELMASLAVLEPQEE